MVKNRYSGNSRKRLIGLAGLAVLLVGGIMFAMWNSANGSISEDNNDAQIIVLGPRSADTPLNINSTMITLNTSSVKRVIETVNITFTNSSYDGDVAYNDIKGYVVNITLSDGKEFNITMYPIENTTYWTALFSPSSTNATGTAQITIMAYNSSGGICHGPYDEPDTSIEIVNNEPRLGVVLNSLQFYRGQTMHLQFMPSDIEDSYENLEWQVSICNSSGEVVDIFIPRGVKNFTYDFQIPSDYNEGIMYINGTCWDKDGGSQSIKYYFTILNNEPVITGVTFEISGEVIADKDDLLTDGVLRGTEDLLVKINCSDYESNSSLRLYIKAIDPATGQDVFAQDANYLNIAPISDGYFEKKITFPLSMAVGVSNLTLVVKDSEGKETSIEYPIKIKNNAPVLEGFAINGSSAENPIEFYPGDIIEFSFNVSDSENTIRYIQVNIFYQDGEAIKTLNYSVRYVNENTTIRIRAEDLPAGVFYVYASVIDADGAVGKSDTVSFVINPEKKSDISVWLLFIIGIVIGFTLGAAVYYWKARVPEANISTLSDKSSIKEDKGKGQKKGGSASKSDKSMGPSDNKAEDGSKSKNNQGKKGKKKVIRKI